MELGVVGIRTFAALLLKIKSNQIKHPLTNTRSYASHCL
jgi:hypothetical protein